MAERAPHSSPRLYAGLLAIQLCGLGLLIHVSFPVYRHLLTQPGVIVDEWPPGIEAILSILAVQAAYWGRRAFVAVPVLRSAFLAHLVMFVGRLSFVFGGALYSIVFFRHAPEMTELPDLGSIAVRAGMLFLCLFSLFCVALELERLGSSARN